MERQMDTDLNGKTTEPASPPEINFESAEELSDPPSMGADEDTSINPVESKETSEEEQEGDEFATNNKSHPKDSNRKRKSSNRRLSDSPSKKKKICEFCKTSDTPMWRRGPQGKGTLCNACGVKWSIKARKAKKKEKTVTPSMPSKKKPRSDGDDISVLQDEWSDESVMRKESPLKLRPLNKEFVSSLMTDFVVSSTEPENSIIPAQVFDQLVSFIESRMVASKEQDVLKTGLLHLKEELTNREKRRVNKIDLLNSTFRNDLTNFNKIVTNQATHREAKITEKAEMLLIELQQDYNRRLRHIQTQIGSTNTLQTLPTLANQLNDFGKQLNETNELVKSLLQSEFSSLRNEIASIIEMKKEVLDIEAETLKLSNQRQLDAEKKLLKKMVSPLNL